MRDWRLAVAEVDKTVNIDYLDSEPEELGSSHSIGVDLSSDDTYQKVVYFSAPPAYLGNQLTAYGGALNYTIFYTTGLFGNIAFCSAELWVIYAGQVQSQVADCLLPFKTKCGIDVDRF
jgi:hypothetical protein